MSITPHRCRLWLSSTGIQTSENLLNKNGKQERRVKDVSESREREREKHDNDVYIIDTFERSFELY